MKIDSYLAQILKQCTSTNAGKTEGNFNNNNQYCLYHQTIANTSIICIGDYLQFIKTIKSTYHRILWIDNKRHQEILKETDWRKRRAQYDHGNNTVPIK